MKRPCDKLVVGTKTICKRNIGEVGKVETYKCRLLAQAVRQIKGLHYLETISPTPAAASIKMELAITAVENCKVRHIDVEQAFLQTDADEEI